MDNLPFTLYRLYDKDEELLYIGKTLNVVARLSNHRAKKDWWREVRVIGLTHYDSILELAVSERIAIKSENPKYNIVRYNGGRTKNLRGPNIGKYDLACEWLLDTLEPGKLYRVTDLMDLAAEEGIASVRTLEKAKADLGIVSRKQVNKWYWVIE